MLRVGPSGAPQAAPYNQDEELEGEVPDHDIRDVGEDQEPEDDVVPRPRKRGPSMGQSIGGVLFGFEQQVWRNIPPPHELVHHARPDDPLPAGDGGLMTLRMPEPLVPPTAAGTGGAQRPEPLIRELAERPTLVVRIVGRMATVDVGTLVDRALPRVGARIEAVGLAIDGPPIVRYLDWGGETADLEIGFPVAGSEALIKAVPEVAAGGGPGRSLLPGGPCAVIVHVGPYRELPVSWGRLMTWVWERDLEPSGPMWESYTDNPDLTEPAVLRTEVLRPLRR